ncbi:MAG TPA: hypothetical protein VFV96_17095 [Verrucomicrobiae bacterium]|nr:hypothetical protein [Verrucomicrobiae bacterium]
MQSFGKNYFRGHIGGCLILVGILFTLFLLLGIASFTRKTGLISEKCSLKIISEPEVGFDYTSFTCVFSNGTIFDLDCEFGVNDTSDNSTMTSTFSAAPPAPIRVKSHSTITNTCKIQQRFPRWRAAASYEKKRNAIAPIRFLQRSTDEALKAHDWIIFSAEVFGSEKSHE